MSAAKSAGGSSTWLNVAVDYGPVLAFFVVYRWAAPAHHDQSIAEVAATIKDIVFHRSASSAHHDSIVGAASGVKDSMTHVGGLLADSDHSFAEVVAVIKGTIAFMIGAVIALAFSLFRFHRVSPMLWLSTALIFFFGGLTIFLRDPVWIQLKPTAIYVIFGAALLSGWLRGRALLKVLLATAFEGLDDTGWLILSRNWGWYFLVLAVLNEVLRHFFNFENHNFGLWLQAKLYLFLPAPFLFTFAHIPMLLRHGLGAEDNAVDAALGSEPPNA